MQYISVKNIEKYHPGYRDRNLLWCKIYFSMINGDPEFELLDEIDQWRYVKLIMLQLQAKKPLLLDRSYLERKGFNYKKRDMSLTLKMLHNFVDVVTEEASEAWPREEKKREEKRREDMYVAFEQATLAAWNNFCNKYPILARVKEITPSRRVCLKRRYTSSAFREFDKLLEAIAAQQFLLGHNAKGWKIDFDWLIKNDTNSVKVIERKYANQGDVHGSARSKLGLKD